MKNIQRNEYSSKSEAKRTSQHDGGLGQKRSEKPSSGQREGTLRQDQIKLKPLDEQVIVVLDAQNEIGRATALLAAEKGAKVVLSFKNLEEIEATAREIRDKGGEVLTFATDISKISDLELLKSHAFGQFGRVDTWVNSLDVPPFAPLLEGNPEQERMMFDANFWGVRNACRAAIHALSKQGGAIVNLGSELSGGSEPEQGLYTASKQAVKAYTDALRMEFEAQGLPISVSLVRTASSDSDEPESTYDSNLVAKAILECAVEPKREVFIGLASRIFTWVDALAPGVADHLVNSRAYAKVNKFTSLFNP